MALGSLPIFLRPRQVILIGDGEAAAAKRRLLERAGAAIVGEEAEASLAIVAIDDDDAARAAVARLTARGILVNAVDRPALCDFTLPAIVDRAPVLVAIGTGGVSAGLAAALRQRLELLLPPGLGRLADALHAARAVLRARFSDAGERRRAIAAMLRPGGSLDPLAPRGTIDIAMAAQGVAEGAASPVRLDRFRLASADPDELTLRQARALADADRVYHATGVPAAILDRARADAARINAPAPPVPAPPGLSVWLEMA